jgi:deoxyribodipyrimidine photolyase
MFEKGLFIFHRDLRIVDNVGLCQAWKQCKSVYVDTKDIHTWYETCKNTQHKDVKYPCPIVDYSKQKEKMLFMYKKQS